MSGTRRGSFSSFPENCKCDSRCVMRYFSVILKGGRNILGNMWNCGNSEQKNWKMKLNVRVHKLNYN